jgi:AraC-like DNA-binding protein
MTARPELRPRVDCTVGCHLRVRLWSHTGGELASRPSAHAAVELAWIDEGTIGYRVGQRTFDVPVGRAITIPSHVEHVTLFPHAMRGGALWIDRDTVAQIADAMGPRARGGAHHEADVLATSPTQLALSHALANEVERREDGHVLAADSIAEAMIVEMLRRSNERDDPGPSRGARDPRVRAAIDHVREGFAEALTVDDLAKSAGMSRFHISRLFRDQVGEAPYRYVQRVRLSRAAELLRAGHHTVSEAALSVGFRDLSRFSRMFRAQLGCRPSDFLRDTRRGRTMYPANGTIRTAPRAIAR